MDLGVCGFVRKVDNRVKQGGAERNEIRRRGARRYNNPRQCEGLGACLIACVWIEAGLNKGRGDSKGERVGE